MAYRVVRNRRTKKIGLEFYKTHQSRVIGRRGEHARRVIIRGGREYHVTKGWR